ncbi:bifunctional proline dehydrogenase/L-glutamate gamma-semialdehyde dehydrogenase PutA [Ferrimonas sediminicola]|uniref:Bifunctional protein PutA n=1 Tax=Ferrimonas sediminicola TaxID=2569538 RepID=A0A4V5NYV5_9GAMM|nr:bifunctional proline dehydrogenase/L-glutamate gamma-semialdehyde dehydrogenase PutA [Ferrimonas sediminicola]TKB51441.1 bifunctional proline dehydrogenase/L-glutamate gamma-semialdehyde dehydrogenase PutA [Ferrimonas sediminicola]
MFKASQVLANGIPTDLSSLKEAISVNHGADESDYLEELLQLVPQDQASIDRITDKAANLVTEVRNVEKRGLAVGIDAFLQQYSLETQEGVILMCLAEALLRIPDAATADALIEDKLSGADWARHLKGSDSVLVNASTWGLMLTGRVVTLDKTLDGNPNHLLARLVNRVGEPIIRKAMYAAMKIMGKQFVLGRSISEALKNSEDNRSLGYTHSYDMLGEGALTMDDAKRHFQEYLDAIHNLGNHQYKNSQAPLPTISVKLTAIHPKFEAAHRELVLEELYRWVIALISEGRKFGVGITMDAEEADRLELYLELFEKLYRSEEAQGWGNFGVVVQAYAKTALPVLCWLNALAGEQGDRIPVRLVKGAYWDSEIKHCQQLGVDNYPVFTRKSATDVSYLACARYLLSDLTRGNLYPQFASHNAHTVAAVMDMAGDRDYEFQRLHGMGQELYDPVLSRHHQLVRIYAPVGAHEDLLPYLVRRLLENGANSSFVHKVVDPNTPVESLIEHPVTTLTQCPTLHNNKIVLPQQIFGSERRNSKGINMNIAVESRTFFAKLDGFKETQWHAAPLIGGKTINCGEARTVTSPQDRRRSVGQVHFADAETIELAVKVANAAFPAWNRTGVDVRANAIEALADLLETHREELIALCTREAGKTLQDGIDEVREAVDFCRYYAVQARKMQGEPTVLPGPTGELNELFVQGRGTFLCISPWNFPLAIFLGQVVAALVTGNTVIAKPAEQTSLVAYRAVQLAHEAGVPGDVLALLPGTGALVGGTLTADDRIGGVCFTGSTQTAKVINRSLAGRDGAIVPLVAETGGQNAMVVDSTSLPEQVVKDVVQSAFASAGQRCSALRVLYVQEEVADKVIGLLKGAMAQLHVGNPALHKTDLGPVIDETAQGNLLAHIDRITEEGKLICQAPLSDECSNGTFIQPTAVEIHSITQLEKEHFGPILHVIRYRSSDLDQVVAEINSTGFGLTLGIHSRNESHALHIADRVNVGNAYINRNQIGAVVGVQPFGGQGLSGTGPKAGGPHYLTRFVTEKTRTNNITAIGGNATLLTLGDG